MKKILKHLKFYKLTYKYDETRIMTKSIYVQINIYYLKNNML